MIAALLYSTAKSEGPSVCRRDLKIARVSGATDEDIIEIYGPDGSTMLKGSGDLSLPLNAEFIQVLHQQASGNPVSVELV